MRSSRTSRSTSVSVSSRLRSPRPWASRRPPPGRPRGPRRGSQQACEVSAARDLFEAAPIRCRLRPTPPACVGRGSRRVRLHVLDAVGAQLAAERGRRRRGDHAIGAFRGEIGSEPVGRNAVRRAVGAVDAREIAVAFDDLVSGGGERVAAGSSRDTAPPVRSSRSRSRWSTCRSLPVPRARPACARQCAPQVGQAGHGHEPIANPLDLVHGDGAGRALTSRACHDPLVGGDLRAPAGLDALRVQQSPAALVRVPGWLCRQATPNRCSLTADRTGRPTYRCRCRSGSRSSSSPSSPHRSRRNGDCRRHSSRPTIGRHRTTEERRPARRWAAESAMTCVCG